MSLSNFVWGLLGKNYTDPSEYDAQTIVMPAVKLVALPTNGTPFAPPKWIIGNAAGTATVVDASGNTLALFPITGQEQHVAVTALNALATTTKIWGGY